MGESPFLRGDGLHVPLSLFNTPGDQVQAYNKHVPVSTPIGTAGQVWTVNDNANAAEWADATGGGGGADTSINFYHDFAITALPSDTDGRPVGIGGTKWFGADPVWAIISNVNPADGAGVSLTTGVYSVETWSNFNTPTGNVEARFMTSGNVNLEDGNAFKVSSLPTFGGTTDVQIYSNRSILAVSAEAPLKIWINGINAGGCTFYGSIRITKLG